MQSAAEFLAGNFFGLDVVAARTDRLAVRLGGAVGPLGDEFTFGDEFRVAVRNRTIPPWGYGVACLA